MTFLQTSELLKGITDLPIAFAAFIFAILLKNKAKRWMCLFYLISASAFIGAFVHCVSVCETARKVIWTVLYLLLFETVRRFAKIIADDSNIEYKTVFAIEILLYFLSIVFLFVFGKYDMLVFVIFSVLMIFRIIVSLASKRYIPKALILIIFIAAAAIIMQILSKKINYAVAAEHILLLAAMFVAYKNAS